MTWGLLLLILVGETFATQAPSVRICIIQDQTGSIRQTRTPTLRLDDLRKILGWVKERGGEVGLGLVQERSDRPLVRLRLRSLPPKPPRPEPPANPLLRGLWKKRELRQWQEKMKAWQTRRRQTQKAIRAFLTKAAKRLQAPLAQHSDVCGAVRRCDLMLAEPFPQPAQNLMLIVSDGRHNVRESPCPKTLRSQAPVILVNGEGLLGVLGRYEPLRFESVEAAIEYIIDSGGKP